MTEAAQRKMTVEEFLDWHDGTDTRHILVEGVIIAMAPPSQNHSRISGNAVLALGRRLKPPCAALSEAGLHVADDTCVTADVVVTCEESAGRLIEAPLLVIEVLSPSNRREDLAYKLLSYQELPTVREIWMIESETRAVRTWRRLNESQWLSALPIREGVVRSEVLKDEVPLDEVYAGTGH